MEPSKSTSFSQKSPKSPSNTIVNQSLNLYLNMKKTKESLVMGSITGILLAVLLFDIKFKKKCSDEYFWSYWYYYIELGAATILGISLIYYVISILYYHFCFEAVKGTSSQRRLLNFDEKSFIEEKPKEAAPKDSIVKENILNLSNLSYQKDISMNVSLNSSAASWFNNTNLSQQSMNQQNNNNDTSFNNTFQIPKNNSMKSMIEDEITLSRYLDEVADKEQKMTAAVNVQSNFSPFNTSNSFWSPNTSNTSKFVEDMNMFLKTNSYQLSPVQTKQSKDEISSLKYTPKVLSAKMSNYVANLRLWISSTILSPLVKEIDKIDVALQHLADYKIGTVGIEKLKKFSENKQLIKLVPQLTTLIPYLELSSNQEYLVRRIRQLNDSCMTDYKFRGEATNDENPTDSGIIFHLFCTYLDGQLWKSPEAQRPFFDRYVLVGASKDIKNKANCAIICTSTIKPKFNFMSDGKIHELANDRNNLFYAILEWLIHMKPYSTLEGVQLGKSGINILCVLEDIKDS